MSLSDDDIFCILINVASLSQNFLDPKRKLKLPSFVSVLRLRTKKNIYIYIHAWVARMPRLTQHKPVWSGLEWTGMLAMRAAGCWLLVASCWHCLLPAGCWRHCWLLATGYCLRRIWKCLGISGWGAEAWGIRFLGLGEPLGASWREARRLAIATWALRKGVRTF